MKKLFFDYVQHWEIDRFMDSRLACLTLGDAGNAVILEKASENTTGFQAIELQTFGHYSQYCISKASAQGGMIMFTDSVKLLMSLSNQARNMQ